MEQPIPDIRLYDCVVLDIDQTLVYTTMENYTERCIKMDILGMHGENMEVFVQKRPGLDKFLNHCFEHCKVGVWSAGQPSYVESIVNTFFPQTPIFVYNWCHCNRDSKRLGSMVFKKLEHIPYVGKILMIDDRMTVLDVCDRVDTYIITPWEPYSDDEDMELHKLVLNDN